MEALVSVIVPVYNVSSYLREALDSVIHQTYKNLEILVIDDGSTDGSETICDEYLSDPRVIVIHQENRGLSGARNTGLDCATGDYIAFLDSDDAYHPDMINLLLQAVLRNKADLAVCAYTDFFKTHMGINKYRHESVTEKEYFLSAKDSAILLLEGSFPANVWSKMYQRKLLESIRFPEGYVYEDVRVMLFLLEKCSNIVVLPQVLVYHRIREGSITNTDTEKNIQDYISAHRAVLDYTKTVQPPYPSEYIAIYREKTLRFLIFKHTALHRSNAFLNSPNFETILLDEIQDLSGNEADFVLTKTKVVFWLYRHCPGLLVPTKACFRFVKSLLGKFKRGRL